MLEKCPPSFKPFRLKALIIIIIIGYNWNLTTVAWCYKYIYAWICPKEISRRVTLSSPQVPGGFIQDSRHFCQFDILYSFKKNIQLVAQGNEQCNLQTMDKNTSNFQCCGNFRCSISKNISSNCQEDPYKTL